MSTPTVSVVMSVYNGERFLPETIESIRNQSYGNFEFIIIDDGSTDNTAQIVEEFAKRDPRISLYRQRNQGLVHSLNRGCRLARGMYLARIDADDIAVPDRLESQVHFLEANQDVGMVGGAAEFINAIGKRLCVATYPTTDEEIRRDLFDGNVFWHPSILMRKSVFVLVGGYRDIKFAEDYDLWLRIAERAKMANLKDVVLKYRIHPGQVSVTSCREQAVSTWMVRVAASLRKQGELDPLSAGGTIPSTLLEAQNISEAEIQTVIARGYLSTVRNLCRIGEYASALSLIKTLHSNEFISAERWVIADSYLWKARACFHERRPAEFAVSCLHAFIARPMLLGRPTRSFARLLRRVGQRSSKSTSVSRSSLITGIRNVMKSHS